MGLREAITMPGEPDVNAAFSKDNIGGAVSYYKSLDKYALGALTAHYLKLSKPETDAFLNWIEANYPADAKDEIKRLIIHALTREKPIPIHFHWEHEGSQNITFSYDPSVPIYKVMITGYLKPLASLLRGRDR